MNLEAQKKNSQDWIAKNYKYILIILLSILIQVLLRYFENWLPLNYLLLIFALVSANVYFIYSLINLEEEKKSKFAIWLRINLTTIFMWSILIGFSFLFVYGVASIPESILPGLWIGAFITVVSILLFRLIRLIKNRR